MIKGNREMPNQSQGWFAKTFPTPSTPQEAANALDSTGKGFFWLGIITVGRVLMAATGGNTPKLHAPQVLPSASH